MAKLARRRLLLDAGALVHLERAPRSDVISGSRRAVRNGYPVLLPSVVLAQVWRDDDRRHGLRMLCRWCEHLDFTTASARRVGRLLKVTGTADIVDAAVVVSAIEKNAAVMTSDPDDLRVLAEAAGADVPLITV